MYESPIELITTTIMSEIVKNQEEQVMNAVQGVGVNVDKDELLKALAYDRQQYEKGYRDGAREILERLQHEIGFNCDLVDVYEHIDSLMKWHTPDKEKGQYYLNLSLHASCKYCGKDIMQDSQGNWF